jgi:hypothetical protein
MQPSEKTLRIDSAETERQRIAPGRQPLAAPPGAATFQQRMVLPRRIRNHQVFAVQHAQEADERRQPELLRRERPLESGLDLLGRSAAVQLLEDEKLLLAQMIVAQRQRILHGQDLASAPALRADDQIAAFAERDRPSSSALLVGRVHQRSPRARMTSDAF